MTVRGETVAGVIDDPICGDWVMTVRGEGAFRRSADGNEHRPRSPSKADRRDGGRVSVASPAAGFARTRFVADDQIAITSAYRLRRMNTDFSLRASAIFLGFRELMPWGFMRPAFCCTRRQGGYGAAATMASLTAHGVAKEPFCAPQFGNMARLAYSSVRLGGPLRPSHARGNVSSSGAAASM